MDEGLISFGKRLDSMMMGRHLSRGEARQMLSEVLMDQQTEMHQGAFLALITANVPTPGEIAGCWEAIYDLDTSRVEPNTSGPLVENCGTGMDTIDTFNISTAASIIAAAEGVCMAKHASRAITSRCGAIDIIEALGVDVGTDVDVVRRSMETAGIGIFNGMSPKVHPIGLCRILSRMRFGTILNIAGSLASPVQPSYAVRGVHSPDLVLPMCETLKEIGLSAAMVVHGLSADGLRGMDEVSPFGRTHVSELLTDGRIISYTISSEDFGLETYDEEDLSPRLEPEEEATRFVELISGREGGIREDIVCMNTAPILYIVGVTDSLFDGYHIAKDCIASGRALSKLEDWVSAQTLDAEGSLRVLRSHMRWMDR